MRLYEITERPLGDYDDDNHKPMLMSGKLVLYRSISLPELKDIFKTQAVMGKGNVFNEFDHRRYVFFGAAPTAKLLWQGNEVERMISTKLAPHAIISKFEALRVLISKAEQDIQDAITMMIARTNFSRESRGEAPLDSKNEEVRRWATPRIDLKLFRARQTLRDKELKLRADYKKIHKGLQAKEWESRKQAQITSALLKTYPIGGGLHYSKQHGKSGMGDEDEYGFRPGAVTLADIETITLFKDSEPVFSGSPAQVKDALKRLSAPKPITEKAALPVLI